MSLNLNDLRNACFRVAKTRASLSGVELSHPTAALNLTENFYEFSAERAMEFFDLGREPKIVNRAVWFLSQIKITVPRGNEVVWFQSCLGLLLEMAFPDKEIIEKGRGDFLGHLYKRFNDSEQVWS